MSEGDGVSLSGMIVGEACMRREHLSGDLNKVIFYKKKKKKKKKKKDGFLGFIFPLHFCSMILLIYPNS